MGLCSQLQEKLDGKEELVKKLKKKVVNSYLKDKI
jgi:hypothetical protein